MRRVPRDARNARSRALIRPVRRSARSEFTRACPRTFRKRAHLEISGDETDAFASPGFKALSMDLNNFRAAVEPILDRYETRFARDSLPDQFVRGRTRTKTLGAIAIKVDERRLRAICGVLTRFAAYFGPNHIVRSAAELVRPRNGGPTRVKR